jgi:thiopurine S-methyltransferase
LDNNFWIQRWEQGKIGFHLDTTHPLLLKYYEQLQLPNKKTVFVPLSGKSLDLAWLQQQGHHVIANELSTTACHTFFSEHQLTLKIQTHDDFTFFQADNLQIICADFFKLKKDMLAETNLVYDRAALIALPEEMRKQYCQQLMSIIPAGTPILLITLEYNQNEMAGPPFSVSEEELSHYFADQYSIQCLCTEDILDQEPHFRSRGLTSLQEKLYFLTTWS